MSIYDLAIIGGGPAGIMAAGRSAELGARVILLEKNPKLGAKLLMTGKGRCNITHQEEDTKKFISVFGSEGRFLYPSLNKFGVNDTLDFFHKFGVETKVERGQRVFPKSDHALDVLLALEKYIRNNNVKLQAETRVIEFKKENNKITKIKTSRGDIIAKNYIITTGGKSYPETGSTGDGYKFAKDLGHEVVEPKASLTSLITKETWIKDLQGLNLENVKISIFQNNKKRDERFGEALFTHEGMSGPIILDMSKNIGELLEKGDVSLQIDFKPALDFPKLDLRIIRDFQLFHDKEFKNSLNKLLPQKLIPVIVRLSEINPYKKASSITKEERKRLIHLLKEFNLNIKNLTGFNKAIVTSGGVKLNQIDPRTMKSKIIDNLYFAGEILNLDGPTGGYNLQVCWSTGYLAGESAKSSTQL